MHVKRFEEAAPYEAPNHRGVVGLRLQGFEPEGPTNQWVGLSQFLPGGQLLGLEVAQVVSAGLCCSARKSRSGVPGGWGRGAGAAGDGDCLGSSTSAAYYEPRARHQAGDAT